MKPFDLKEYLQNPNKKIVTRFGSLVRILCTDRRDDSFTESPIVALVPNLDGGEDAIYYKENGICYESMNHDLDLFFATEKRDGWINIYADSAGRAGSYIYRTQKEAISVGKGNPNYVATVKIEWEEE